MRRFFSILCAAAVLFCCVACAKKAEVEIKENLYLTQINDIYRNREEYLGKSIHLEGLYFSSEAGGEAYQMVRRYGPSCCDLDGAAGFEFLWEGRAPEQNDWIEVWGTLEQYQKADGFFYLRLRLSDLKVKEQAGEEYVSK